MIGFIGGGNMAEALIQGITSKGTRDVMVSEPRDERRRHLESRYGVRSTVSNREVVSSCELIVLAVKPQNMADVLEEIGGAVSDDHTVVSIAAGIPLSYLKEKLKTPRLVRVMPNTPALVQEGMSVMSLCECLPDRHIAPIREMLMSVGKVIALPEKYMDTVTALSGSGPAFIALFVEAMRDSGAAMGLTVEQAAELAMQTLIGTAKLLDTGMTPEHLREMVTSPGGTTAAGLRVFEEGGLRSLVASALLAARRRAEELGKEK